MLRSRRILICLILLGLFALVTPVMALAQGGGGSAGDNQYTDPLSGSPPPTQTNTNTAPTTSTSSAPPATSTAPSSDATTTTSTPTPTPTPAPTATAPTATIASSTGTGTSAQLPYTGYDGGLAAAIGFVLAGGGIVLRLRTQRGPARRRSARTP
jgi:cytoskeletal protein RodZ